MCFYLQHPIQKPSAFSRGGYRFSLLYRTSNPLQNVGNRHSVAMNDPNSFRWYHSFTALIGQSGESFTTITGRRTWNLFSNE